MVRTIAGRNNPSVKLAHKLQKKKYRREQGLFLAEGLDLVEVAAATGIEPVELLVREDVLPRLPARLRTGAAEGRLNIGVCSSDTLARASGLGGVADVVGLYRQQVCSLGDLDCGGGVVVFLCGGDPGNVGTLVRSAAAFGARGVICSPRTADPYGPKAIRAGMGAHCMVPLVVEVTPEELTAKLVTRERQGLGMPSVLVADPRGEQLTTELASELTATECTLLVLGSERGGTPEFGLPSRRVAVAMAPGVDSLNVAMAGAILPHELFQGRLGKADRGC